MICFKPSPPARFGLWRWATRLGTACACLQAASLLWNSEWQSRSHCSFSTGEIVRLQIESTDWSLLVGDG
jgi:hypothetical protein